MSRVSLSTASNTASNVVWNQLYLGIGFTTLATLMLELSLTRIFSVVFYYHFAFLAISVALFGLGAGGVFSYVVSGWPGNIYRSLGKLTAANSFAIIAALWFVLSRPGDPGNGTLAAVYLATALPFFFSDLSIFSSNPFPQCSHLSGSLAPSAIFSAPSTRT